MIPSDPHPPAHPEALEGSSASKEPHPVWGSIPSPSTGCICADVRGQVRGAPKPTRTAPSPPPPLLTEFCHVNGAFWGREAVINSRPPLTRRASGLSVRSLPTGISMSLILKYLALLVVLTLTLAAVACSSESDSSAEGADSGETVTAGGKLSANNASVEELGGGVRSGGHYERRATVAHEVEEYRPYSVDDTDFAKLRRELAKYNPGPSVIDSIIDLLELP